MMWIWVYWIAFTFGHNSDKALVVIDVQSSFIVRGGDHRMPENLSVVKSFVEAQQKAIQDAKNLGIPIFLFEMDPTRFGRVNWSLVQSVKDYAGGTILPKSFNSIFSGPSDFEWILAEKGIKVLMVTGANGGACVFSSIDEALRRGLHVVAITPGIADFNKSKFVANYSYGKAFETSTYVGRFQSADSVSEAIAIIPRDGWRRVSRFKLCVGQMLRRLFEP